MRRRIKIGRKPGSTARIVGWVLAWGIGVIAAAAQAAPALAEKAEPKRVLIIHSFGQRFEPFSTAAALFRTELALRSPDPIEFYEVSLETARFAEGDVDETLADYMGVLRSRRPLDLVVPISSPALRFCVRHHERLFSSIPILSIATERRHFESIDLGDNATSVGFSLDLVASVEDILHTFPATTNITVALGSSPLERYWMEESRRVLRVFSDRVEFDWLNDLTLSGMTERVGALPPHSVILFMMVDVDADGVTYEQHAALETLHRAANAPIIGLFEQQLGWGVVGGRLVRTRDLSVQSALTAVRILGGESASAIPSVTIPPPSPIFDWRELKRWGVEENELPAGSEVRFRQPTMWEAYKWRIVIVAAVCILQAILIARLLWTRSRLRATRETLLENQRNMRLATRAARLGVWMLDLERDRLWVSDEGRELFGWHPSEPLNWDRYIATLRPEDREPAGHRLRAALDGGAEVQAEYSVTLADGSERWIATWGRVEFDRKHKPVCLRGVSMDISASKQAALEVQELRRKLMQTGRVSLLSQFTATLTHELGQPLGAIMRNADAAELLLKNGPPDVDELNAILTDVRRDGRRAAEVIERWRGMLKLGDIEMQTLIWKDLVAEILQIVRADALNRGVVFQIGDSHDLPPVRGDRFHMLQVLLNLVVNALDACNARPRGERCITIAARWLEDGWIEASVSDTGCGIPDNRLSCIFDHFYTTKPDGMGMGLPISRSIIEAHGGRIWAENNPGGGAAFRFTLPAAAPKEAS